MTLEIERLVAEERARAMKELREGLHGASNALLAKLAVDLVPPLFRNDYRGELAATGGRWADAYARPRVAGLPSFLVRVHSGTFGAGDAADLREAMQGAHIAQGALAVIADHPFTVDLRGALGAQVPWLLDTDGLVHLMLNANVGVTSRVYETKCVDISYFR